MMGEILFVLTQRRCLECWKTSLFGIVPPFWMRLPHLALPIGPFARVNFRTISCKNFSLTIKIFLGHPIRRYLRICLKFPYTEYCWHISRHSRLPLAGSMVSGTRSYAFVQRQFARMAENRSCLVDRCVLYSNSEQEHRSVRLRMKNSKRIHFVVMIANKIGKDFSPSRSTSGKVMQISDIGFPNVLLTTTGWPIFKGISQSLPYRSKRICGYTTRYSQLIQK